MNATHPSAASPVGFIIGRSVAAGLAEALRSQLEAIEAMAARSLVLDEHATETGSPRDSLSQQLTPTLTSISEKAVTARRLAEELCQRIDGLAP